MKNKIELEQDIMTMTATIHRRFPELSKYITEMPVKNGKDSEINIKNLTDYYQSLEVVVGQYAKTHQPETVVKNKKVRLFDSYPLYPSEDDIYQHNKEESDLDPEDPSTNKTPNVNGNLLNEMDLDTNRSGDDLDVPGSELDDQQESVGSEDEENNYYSLGGDDHNDLEESRT